MMRVVVISKTIIIITIKAIVLATLKAYYVIMYKGRCRSSCMSRSRSMLCNEVQRGSKPCDHVCLVACAVSLSMFLGIPHEGDKIKVGYVSCLKALPHSITFAH